MLGVGAFLYANVVYTPEILEANEQMRMENRQEEVAKLLQAVKSGSIRELRPALEAALGRRVEDYVEQVQQNSGKGDSAWTEADAELATTP